MSLEHVTESPKGGTERLLHALMDRFGRANAIAFGRCSLESASPSAKRRGEPTGPNLQLSE